jgi:DNA-binding transcriptional regulator YdaS (Cro superfamily)
MQKLKEFLNQKPPYEPPVDQLAKELGIKKEFVRAIAYGSKACPIRHALKIEQFTGGAVTRKDLRPKDWHLIWPDLEGEK